ncbi:hypothetical protein ACFL3M_03605 [Patescibacteria group bacterium]
MGLFEGENFSTIHDQMPARKCDKEKFFSDWSTQAREGNEFMNDKDEQIIKETAISHFYSIYEELLDMAEESDLNQGEKEKVMSDLNLAMTNVLEFAQRRDMDILSSLKDRRFSSEEAANDKRKDFFNDVMDILIDGFEEGKKKYQDAVNQ